MRPKRRWMRWIFEEVDQFDTVLPWERGYRRSGWKTPPVTSKLPRLLARG
jgi:hypothetical protein